VGRIGRREQRIEIREQRTENREQRTENREQRTENREQRTENRVVKASWRPGSAWGLAAGWEPALSQNDISILSVSRFLEYCSALGGFVFTRLG
jgi:hypothetical protein